MEKISITKIENEIANKEAAYLYGYLRKKYSNESTSNLDIILNSLSFALLRLLHLHVRKQDRAMMINIISKILENGINDSEEEK